MPEVMYGGRQGERLQLEVDPELVAVRTRSRRSFRDGPVAGPEAAVLDGMELVLDFPGGRGRGVPAAGPGPRGRWPRSKRRWSRRPTPASPATCWSTRAGEPVLYTENLFVKFRDDVDRRRTARRVLLEAGLTDQGRAGVRHQRLLRRRPRGHRPGGLRHRRAAAGARRRRVLPTRSWSASCGRRASSRSSGTWPRPRSAARVNASANVAAAHALTQGEQVTIAIIDDGVDVDHEEFASAGKIVAPRDATSARRRPAARARRATTAPPAPAWPAPTACRGLRGRPKAQADAHPAGLPARVPARGQRLLLGRRPRGGRHLLQLGTGGRRLVGPGRPAAPTPRPAARQHPAGHRPRRHPGPRRQGLRGPVRRRQRQRERSTSTATPATSRSSPSPPATTAASAASTATSATPCSARSPATTSACAAEGRPAPLTPGIWTTDSPGRAATTPAPRPGRRRRATTPTPSAAPPAPALGRPAWRRWSWLATRSCAGTRSRTSCAGPATGSTPRTASGAPRATAPVRVRPAQRRDRRPAGPSRSRPTGWSSPGRRPPPRPRRRCGRR